MPVKYKDSCTTSEYTFYFTLATIAGKRNKKLPKHWYFNSIVPVLLLVISHPCSKTKQIPERLLSLVEALMRNILNEVIFFHL